MRQFLDASTHKEYKAGWNHYIAFSRSFNIPPSPLTTEKVTLFVAYLGSEGLSVSTIQSYMADLTSLSNPGRPRELFSILSLIWQFCCEGLSLPITAEGKNNLVAHYSIHNVSNQISARSKRLIILQHPYMGRMLCGISPMQRVLGPRWRQF